MLANWLDWSRFEYCIAQFKSGLRKKIGYGTVRAGDLHLCFNRDLCKNLQHKGAIQCIHIHRHGGYEFFAESWKKLWHPYWTKKKNQDPPIKQRRKWVRAKLRWYGLITTLLPHIKNKKVWRWWDIDPMSKQWNIERKRLYYF